MDEEIIEKIREIGKAKNFIQAIYLFGSQARGNANRDSDIDIAVLLEADYTEKSGAIKIQLYEELIKAGLDNIDLVILNQASALLKYEVVKENSLVYKKNDFNSASYQSLMIRKYLDFEYYLKQNQQKFKERILNG